VISVPDLQLNSNEFATFTEAIFSLPPSIYGTQIPS